MGWEIGVWVSASLPLVVGIVFPPLLLRWALREAWNSESDREMITAHANTVVAGNVSSATGTELQRLLSQNASE